MLNLSAAISSIRANQVGLQVVGNNISNANVPGYHRQDVRFTERAPVDYNGIYIGQGVDVAEIHRSYDRVTEEAVTRNITDKAAVEMRLKTVRELESMFTPAQGTVLDRLENLFNELERFTANPDDIATRSIVIRTAEGLANEINTVDRQLGEIIHRIGADVDAKVATLNSKSAEIVELNRQILQAQMQQRSPNDLLDQRNRLVNELAEIIDVEIITIKHETPNQTYAAPALSIGGGQLVLTDQPVELGTIRDPSGRLVLCRKGGSGLMEVHEGQIGGMLDASALADEYRARLDGFVQGLVNTLDRLHAVGVGTNGTFEQVIGQRFISDVTSPLAQVQTIVPVQADTMLIGITDSDGNRVIEEIAIDPNVDSLTDVAARISNVDHLQGLVISPPGQLVINAQPGYRFDFMAARPASITTSSITGTAQPTLSGHYEGDSDEEYTFEFLQNGDVGNATNLTMRVTDQNGGLVAEHQLGSGYEPGSPIEIARDVQLRLSPGQINAGDVFTVRLSHEPDATSFLAATGMNTLFAGQSAQDLHLSKRIQNDHGLLATTRSGEPLDSRNAEAMAQARYANNLENGTQSLEEYFTDIIGSVGTDVLDLSTTEETLSVISQNLEAERASASGVDPNEEAVKLLQFQRAFQSTARYISAVDEMFRSLIGMLG